MKEIVVLGAGSHTRSFLSLLKDCEYNVKCVVDIHSTQVTNEKINDVKVVNKNFQYSEMYRTLSIGDNNLRASFFSKEEKVLSENLIHKKAFIAPSTTLGASNQIFSNVFVNENVTIKDNNIINTGAIIEHECKIGSHNHISIAAVIAGRVQIEDRCFIGANSTIIDKVNICSDVVIGAGSVVLKDITESGTYVGNPIRKIK